MFHQKIRAAAPTAYCLYLLIPAFASAAVAQSQPAASVNQSGSKPTNTGGEIQLKPERLSETIVTATRRDEQVFDVPYTAYIIDRNDATTIKLRRTTPDIASQIPQIMGQKTAAGQGSPFMRGFTGYNTLFLIDGIRLNNSAFRSGPNQYWSTVDPFSYERLEIVMGPSSVLYGSDAVGGVVNAFSNRRLTFEPGVHANGRVFIRWAEAESTFIERVEGSANINDSFGIFAGITYKDIGDTRAGNPTGVQNNSGYWDLDGDVRADFKLSDQVWLTTVFQHVDQDHVPRTHSTQFGKPFHGTKPGTELKRDHDQTRDLLYARITRAESPDSIDREQFTLYWHRQQEGRERTPSAGNMDISGFDVQSPGVQAQMTRDTALGIVTGGIEYQHDFVQSFKYNIKKVGADTTDIQGSLGDNAGYDLLGIYLQDSIQLGPFELTPGVRFTHAHAFANQVDNPAVNGSLPTTPNNIIDISDRWNEVTGSLRGLYHVTEDLNIFAGVSQGFRAPSLSDLTAFDETSAKEFPSPGLKAERFLQEEIGVKARGDEWSAQVSYWETQLVDTIVPSPTGLLFGTTPVVKKANTGDGYIHGAEAQGSWNFIDNLTAMGWVSWQEGYVDQTIFPPAVPSPATKRAPISRAMPLSAMLGFHYGPKDNKWFAEIAFRGAEKQDKLSLKDKTDVQRIPPGGTPGWVVADLRGGYKITDNVLITAALENVGNADYRIHGSGINEPGTNFIIGVDIRF
ncbi:MAG: TonB-dependent receptor [Planctomycetota bacterium]